jgi:hypothetical protein
VCTATDCDILRLSKLALDEVLEDYPGVREKMNALATARKQEKVHKEKKLASKVIGLWKIDESNEVQPPPFILVYPSFTHTGS